MATVEELPEWLMSMGCGPMPTTAKNKALEKYYLSALLLLKEKFQELMQEKCDENGKKESNKKKLLAVTDKAENEPPVTKVTVTRGVRKLYDVQTLKSIGKEKQTLKEKAKTTKLSKKTIKGEPEDLTDSLENMKIQGDKGCSCKGECKTKVCGCRKKESSCSASCKCSAQCVNKPKVLKKEARSKKDLAEKVPEPAAELGSSEPDSFDSESNSNEPDSEESDDSFDDKPVADSRPSMDDTQELGKEEVDWEKHLAKLVQCPKCSRRFFARRLEKHVEVCKSI